MRTPFSRSVLRSDSIQRIRGGITAAIFIISGHDQRWRMNASWVEIALRRIAVFQSRPPSVDRVLDLARDEVDHSDEDLVLVRDVVVERHRLDAEVLGEPAHAERVDALAVGEVDRGARARAPCSAACGSGRGGGTWLFCGFHARLTLYVCGRRLTNLRRML